MKKFTFLLLLLIAYTGLITAQTTIDSQGFETDQSGYSHTPSQTPATDPGDQYFYRAEPSDPNIYEGSVGPYTNVTGDWLFVGSNPNTINGGNPGILLLAPISVTGYTDLEFHADFGACDNDWDTSDDLKVEYNFDGGSWATLYYFEATGDGTNEPLELLGNATGGINTSNGTVLTYDLTTISSDNFTGSGSTLNIRIVQDAGANYEAFGVDNIEIKGLASGGVSNPTAFEAVTGGTDNIDLSWTKNAAGDNVMVAYTTDGNFGTPVDGTAYIVGNTLPGDGGEVIYNGDQTAFNHTSLTADTRYYYNAWSVDATPDYSSGVTDDTTTYAVEPTAHPTGFTATTNSASEITLDWMDASPAADNYLIKGSDIDFASIANPDDGITETDALLVQNVASGVESHQFTGLAPGTTYYFQIYPYNGDNGSVNYKKDSPQQASETTDSHTDPNAWINEFHYDNAGSDVGEFVEIVIENPTNYTLSDFQLDLYNGGNSSSYDNETVDNFTVGTTEGNFTFYYWEPSSIQNGAPDGLALSYQGILITGQFISYEGSFVAVGGPADGVTSTDIGVSEGGGTQIGESLQLKGGGDTYDLFSWRWPFPETPGALNNWQMLGSDYTTWIGTTDNTWLTASNWNNGVPDASKNVVIRQGMTQYPTLTAAGPACNDILIEADASLVEVGHLSVSGTATVVRDIDEYTGNDDGFHFLSSPVSGLAIVTSDFLPVSGTDDFYAWDETTGYWLNYFGGNFPDTDFGVGKGYLVGYNPVRDAAFTGSLNTSVPAISLSYTPTSLGEGWNLLGNPFPSAIDWDLVTLSGNINGTVHILRGSDNTYVDWNGSTGDLTDGHIPINNGFFVLTNETGTSITMEPADQVHGSSGFLKKASGNEPENTLKVIVSTASFVNNTYIQFREDASVEFDNAIDGYKLFGSGSGPQAFTKLDDIQYSINCLPFTTENFDLPLGFVTKTEGEYTISTQGANSFVDGQFEVILEDLQTSDLTDIGTETYTFTADEEGNENRFILHFYGVTSVNEPIATTEAQIYAAGNTVYIRFNNVSKDGSQVEVFNTLGQQVYNNELTPQSLSSFTLNEKPGIYIVRLRTENGLITQKVMIK